MRSPRHCRCTPENWPCRYCARDLNRAEIEAFDPEDERDSVAANERFYEKYLDRIGGSR